MRSANANPILLICADDQVEWRTVIVWCNSYCSYVSDSMDFLLNLYRIYIFSGISGTFSFTWYTLVEFALHRHS